MEHASFPLETKFVGDGRTGTFEGYAAVFGNVDSHGDVIEPGAFAASLAARQREGRGLPPMYLMHGIVTGNRHEPIGVWEAMSEDSKGLYVRGRLVGMQTDRGRWNYALLQSGALGGLSIGYKAERTRPGSGGVRRYLQAVRINEVSLVDEPSNERALVTSVKTAQPEPRVIEGYATLWGRLHLHPTTGGYEIFAKGCFSGPVGGTPIRLLIGHDPAKQVADTENGLEFITDDAGLAFRCALPMAGQYAEEAWGMVSKGRSDVSVGYAIKEEETVRVDGEAVRIIREAMLAEISLVSQGAVRQAFAIPAESKGMRLTHRVHNMQLLSDGAHAKMMAAFRQLSQDLPQGLTDARV